jgi:hypothetical protein
VNCGRPGGTTFASVVSKDSMGAKFRELRAFCNAAEPCGLNINIAVGNFENINDILKMIDGEIYTAKNEIIIDKNNLLFGLITTEKALSNFDLHYYFDAKTTSSNGNLYNDDGTTANGFEKGQFEILNFKANAAANILTIDFTSETGKSFTASDKNVNLLLHHGSKL